jgi:hypothetical protein
MKQAIKMLKVEPRLTMGVSLHMTNQEAQNIKKMEGVKMKMDEIIKNAEEIKIVSGEGEQGTIEDYEEKRTERAICMRLAKEESGGDRWAYVRIDGVRYDRKGSVLEPRY